MKSGFRKPYKLIISALFLCGMLGAVSCSSREEGINESVLTLAKDGTIQAAIEESFGKAYYDEEELQQAILEQAASYNRNTGSGSISLEKVEVKDDRVAVRMTYAHARDYASFNHVTFFVGTAKEARDAGYNLNVVLSSVKDDKDTIGQADILALEGEKLLIADINEGIGLNGKALYVSDNVTVSSNAKTVWRTDDGDGLAYIIYK